jgi:hypothetical protein
LTRSTDEFFPNLIGKLNYRDEVAYTEAKAHRDVERSAIIVEQEGELESEKKTSHRDGEHFVALSLAR